MIAHIMSFAYLPGTMEKQVCSVSKSFFLQIRKIGRIRSYITDDACKTLGLLGTLECHPHNNDSSYYVFCISARSALRTCSISSAPAQTLAEHQTIEFLANRLEEHLESNSLHDDLQSAYRVCHSTETALLRVHHDITLCSIASAPAQILAEHQTI
jgi:hypothetical protein